MASSASAARSTIAGVAAAAVISTGGSSSSSGSSPARQAVASSSSSGAIRSSSVASVASSSSSAAARSSTSASASSSIFSAMSSTNLSTRPSSSSPSTAPLSSSVSSGFVGSDASPSSSGKGLSGALIGGIVGGVVGGLLLLVLLWTFWRRSREREPKVAPPPPRDIAYVPHSLGRQRMPSKTHLASGAMQRASSYSTLLHDQPSAYNPHSREPLYYNSYPIATPSTMSHDASPPMLPSTSFGSPPLSAQATGTNTPAKQPSLSPITSTVQRDDSSSSDGRVLHKGSTDRLRTQAVERAPSITSMQFPTPGPSEFDGSSRANSPHPSSLGLSSRQPSAFPAYPRPHSMTSMSSSRAALSGPYGGAPHQGRPVQLEMPRLLGARPDQNGDFFWGTAKPTEGFDAGLEEARTSHPRMLSGYRW